MRSGIYAITNLANGRKYIGSAAYLRKRFSAHLRLLRVGLHHSPKLQAAWNKHGADAFRFDPILLCDKHNLLMYEQRAIDAFNSANGGYNVLPVAGSHLGAKRSEESCKRLAAARRGHRHSDESRKKISDANKGMKHGFQRGYKVNVGRGISAETRAKISASLLGKQNSLGNVHSDETRSKISSAMKGNKRRVGKVHSDETKAAIAVAIKKRNHEKRMRGKH